MGDKKKDQKFDVDAPQDEDHSSLNDLEEKINYNIAMSKVVSRIETIFQHNFKY